MTVHAGSGAAPEARPGAGVVEVWTASVSSLAGTADLERMLAPGERSHAAVLRSGTARGRFVATRALLRRLLAGYLGREPREIELGSCPGGKPELRGAASPGIHFNVSHSGDLALLAFAQDVEVGVDVERERDRRDLAALAARFLAPEEHAAIVAKPARERLRAFLAIWTAKEALLKARGDGLPGLEDVRVALGPEGASAVPPQVPGDGGPRWSIRTLLPAPGYVGALAARRPGGTVLVRMLPWSGSLEARRPAHPWIAA